MEPSTENTLSSLASGGQVAIYSTASTPSTTAARGRGLHCTARGRAAVELKLGEATGTAGTDRQDCR